MPLRGFKASRTAAFPGLRRLRSRRRRRTAPSLDGLEVRMLLSVQGVGAPVVESVRPEALIHGEIHRPRAARVNKSVKFIDSLYRKYYHGAPDAQELSYALEQLATGLGHQALKEDFRAVTSKTGKGIPAQTFVTALYVTIAGESPTSVGLAFWQGLLVSGDSRSQVRCLPGS